MISLPIPRHILKNLAALALVAFVTACIAPQSAGAQTSFGLGVQIELLPAHPQPFSAVSATAVSHSLDLNRANISWYLDGTVITQGIGAVRTNFTLGGAGTATTLKVVAQGENGQTESKQVTIRPAYVGIAWESDGYVPPMYAGKSLVAPGSRVTLIAMPFLTRQNGTVISPEELVYVWKRGGREIPGASGFGKRTLSISNDTYLRPLDILVEVSSRQGDIRGVGRVIIPIASTAIYWYEDHPLLGMRYMNAVNNSFVIDHETTLVAEPFYYSVGSRNDAPLEYSWNVNRENAGFATAFITLRPQGSQAGKAEISLTARHLSQLLQSNRLTRTLTFTPDTSVPEPASF